MPALFILDVLLVVAFAYFLTTAVRPPTRPSFLVSFYIFVWMALVFTTEVLSLLHLVTAWGMAAGHFGLAAGAFLVWTAAGRPRPPSLAWPSARGPAGSLRSNPDLGALGGLVGAGYALLGLINILVPPNNFDSMEYHLTRVGYWIQHRTLALWPTISLTQTRYPVNAEIGLLWSMGFLRSDFLAGLVQWSAALAAAIAVFGLARAFGGSRAQSGFAAVVFLTLPMIVLESTTTQNDLTAAAMVSAMAFLFLVGLKTRHRGMLALSGAAAGLALGTKLSVPMGVPGFGLAVLYLLLARRPRPVRPFLFWGGACLGGFILLGSFNYVQNVLYSGNPIGDKAMVEHELAGSDSRSLSFVGRNVYRDVFSFADFSGMPKPVARLGVKARVGLGEAITGRPAARAAAVSSRRSKRAKEIDYHFPMPLVSEAGSFFGPLGIVLLLPLVFFWSIKGLLRRDDRLVPALTFLGFMIVLGGSQAWTPFRGRFYCPAVALVAALAAGLYRRRLPGIALRTAVGAVAATTLIVTLLTNVQKPLIGKEAIWGKDRAERRLTVLRRTKFPIEYIRKNIPRGARVATLLGYGDPEYFVFGDHLDRTLEPIYPLPRRIDLDVLDRNSCDYFVLRIGKLTKLDEPPEDLYSIFWRGPYAVIIRKQPRALPGPGR